MAVKITRTDYTAEDLRREAGRARTPAASRRMLAIALVLEDVSRRDAARQCGMDRQTLRDWVHRFNAEGLEGLYDRRRPGPAPRLTPEQETDLGRMVRDGPDLERDGVVRWRRVDLQVLIKERFEVAYHERTVGKVLHRLGFSHVSTRARHPKADEESQEAFKKTSPSW
jgi:transposase